MKDRNSTSKKGAFHEHVYRSLVKAISFRSLILISDGFIIYAITHRVDMTAGVVIFSNIASTFLYLLHERVWNHVRWGKSS